MVRNPNEKNMDSRSMEIREKEKNVRRIQKVGKMKCPCEKCKFLETCPDMYACKEWVEWAMTEE